MLACKRAVLVLQLYLFIVLIEPLFQCFPLGCICLVKYVEQGLLHRLYHQLNTLNDVINAFGVTCTRGHGQRQELDVGGMSMCPCTCYASMYMQQIPKDHLSAN